MAENPDNDIIAHEPNRVLRELIGEDTKLSEVFTKDRIEACQSSIDSARGSFFDVAGADLDKLEKLVREQSAAPKISDTVFEDIAGLAADIRGHAEIFGFTLIATISNHIADYCQTNAHTPEARFRLIVDLIKMLHIAIKEKVGDKYDAVARELDAILKNY